MSILKYWTLSSLTFFNYKVLPVCDFFVYATVEVHHAGWKVLDLGKNSRPWKVLELIKGFFSLTSKYI